MSVRSKCPECGKGIQISLAHAGKKGKCPGCGKSLKMPSEEQLRKMMAKQASRSGVAAAPAAPATPSAPPAAAPQDDLFDDLSSSNFDDDDFNFPEPKAEEPEEAPNPYASPLSEYKAQLAQANKIVYAGFFARWGAAIVDGLILVVMSWGIGFGLGILGFASGVAQSENGILMLQLVVQVVNQLAALLYFALMEASASQATYGKQMAGIKVTDTKGQPISFGRAAGRYLGKILSTLTLMIGYLMAAFTPKKQALHDMLAGTLVVKA